MHVRSIYNHILCARPYACDGFADQFIIIFYMLGLMLVIDADQFIIIFSFRAFACDRFDDFYCMI